MTNFKLNFRGWKAVDIKSKQIRPNVKGLDFLIRFRKLWHKY